MLNIKSIQEDFQSKSQISNFIFFFSCFRIQDIKPNNFTHYSSYKSRSQTMKCKLIYFRLAVEWLAILFFAISGVICLSAYFDSQNLQENERIILRISGIVHLVLFVLAFLSCSNTTTILGPYISEDCKSSISKTIIKIEKLNKPSVPNVSIDVITLSFWWKSSETLL